MKRYEYIKKILIIASGIEITAIHDRPEGSVLGSYYYIIETESPDGISEEQIGKVLNHAEVRYLGCFDVITKQSAESEG